MCSGDITDAKDHGSFWLDSRQYQEEWTSYKSTISSVLNKTHWLDIRFVDCVSLFRLNSVISSLQLEEITITSTFRNCMIQLTCLNSTQHKAKVTNGRTYIKRKPMA